MQRAGGGVSVADLGERTLIERLRPRLPVRADILAGAGDDCAVVRPAPDSAEDWVLKSDPVIAGRHFSPETDPVLVGRKAVGRVLSDLAAMGAEPRWGLVNLVLPADYPVAAVEALYAGMLDLAGRYGLALVGGDTSQGSELALHVFACGALPRGTARLRSGAAVGDGLYVTGELGGSLAGHHLTFEPRVREGLWLRERVGAMIDISDGLASELWHLAVAGGLALEVETARIPISVVAARAPSPLQAALQDGEDFELLFSVPAAREPDWARAWSAAFPALRCTGIGRVVAAAPGGAVHRLGPDGRRESLPRGGFEHFREGSASGVGGVGAEKDRALEFEVRDEAATAAFARRLGELAGAGAVVALHGPLGVGKTRFAQGLALALGVREPVCSPTFTLANEHTGRRGVRFLHLDLYRLEDEDAVAAFGFEELLEGAALAAVEWPERAGALLPQRTIHVWMTEAAAPEARRIRVAFPDGARKERPAASLTGIAGVRRI